MVVVAHVVGTERGIVRLYEAIAEAGVEALEHKVHVGIAGEAHQGGVSHVEDLVEVGLDGHLLGARISAEDAGGGIGREAHPAEGGDAALQAHDDVVLRRDAVAPALVEGVLLVVGIEHVEVQVVLAAAVAGLESPSHAAVLGRAGKGVGGVVVDGLAQASVEDAAAPALAVVVLESDSVERHVHHIVAHGDGALADVARPALVRRRQIEGDLRIVEVEIIVRIVERERHSKAIDADVQVGIDGVIQRRGVSRPAGIVVGVLRAYRASYDQRVGISNLIDVLGMHCSRHRDHEHQHPKGFTRFHLSLLYILI